jgi:hypothetical protein
MILLVAAVTVDLVATLSDLASHSLFSNASRTGLLAPAQARANDLRQGLIALGQLLLLLSTGIVFLIWFHRCYKNLEALGVTDLRFKAGWAIGGWFVPFLNLWRPKQIADDIWKATEPEAPVEQSEAWKSNGVPAVITLWWIAWLVSGAVGQAAGGAVGTQQTLDQLARGATIMAIADLVGAVAGVLAIAVVGKLTNRQRDRALRLQAAASQPTPVAA